MCVCVCLWRSGGLGNQTGWALWTSFALVGETFARSQLFHPFPFPARNADGFLDAEELVEIFRVSGESVTEEEIQELMRDGDKNNDGRIDFDGEQLRWTDGWSFLGADPELSSPLPPRGRKDLTQPSPYVEFGTPGAKTPGRSPSWNPRAIQVGGRGGRPFGGGLPSLAPDPIWEGVLAAHPHWGG